VWETIAADAAAESPLWAESLLPGDRQHREAVFSSLCPARHALGLETIYEGYLVHYGRPRLFEPPDADAALLLGDYLYAHGLVRIAASGDVAAVADLAELISLCAQARADGTLVPEADPDGLARFLVAGLEGAILLTKVQKDIRIMETCVGELRRHLGLYLATSSAEEHAPPVGGPR